MTRRSFPKHAENRQTVWQAVVQEDSGSVYYWNTLSDETAWERPPEMLRVSTAQTTFKRRVRNLKGDALSPSIS